MSKLTKKQEAFCREYMKDLNGTQAAIRAGYSEKTANSIGTENLAKPAIANFISGLMANRNEDVKIDADYVLKRLIQIDQMDFIDILEEDGSFRPVSKWPKVWRTYLSGIDITEMHTDGQMAGMLKKIKWPDKVKNLELLGKHINVQAFKDKAEVDVTITHEQWLDTLE